MARRPRNSLDAYQDIIVKLHGEGLGAAEIAARIGCQAPAVRQRLHRAGIELERRKKGGRQGGPTPYKRAHAGAESRLPHLHLPRVNRDPCTFCGTRGDIPCRHRVRWDGL
jgi:hypothetical protein